MSLRTQRSIVETEGGTRLLIALCALEFALLLGAVAWQKAPDLLTTPPGGKVGAVLLAAVIIGGVALATILRTLRGAGPTGHRRFAFALLVNLAALGFALVAAEALLRGVAVPTSAGLAVGNLMIPPTWQESRARNKALLGGAPTARRHWLSYVVSDAELGWTIGQNRRSSDGLYFSSVEGIRSGTMNVVYANRRPALRIALVGDSYTFSMDGPFEDSWGYQLEQRLGPAVQVLNFGVDGYGIDQAYLRYRREVRQWHPDIVLFGLVQHDLDRTVAVYPFLSFSWDYPFAKPRFVLAGDQLRLINTPLVTAEEIIAVTDVRRLPYAEYDRGYVLGDWRWRRGEPPVLARLFASAFPRWPPIPDRVSGATAMAISGRLLQNFLREAAADGRQARIIYFPTQGAGDFGRELQPEARIGHRMLAAYEVPHLDLTSCVARVPAAQRLVPGQVHYTGRANGAVAACIEDDLAARGLLRVLKPATRGADGAGTGAIGKIGGIGAGGGT